MNACFIISVVLYVVLYNHDVYADDEFRDRITWSNESTNGIKLGVYCIDVQKGELGLYITKDTANTNKYQKIYIDSNVGVIVTAKSKDGNQLKYKSKDVSGWKSSNIINLSFTNYSKYPIRYVGTGETYVKSINVKDIFKITKSGDYEVNVETYIYIKRDNGSVLYPVFMPVAKVSLWLEAD